MPAAVIAVAAAVGTELIAGVALANIAWGTVLAKAAFSYGLSLVAESLQESPAQQAAPVSSEIASRKQLIRTSAAPRRMIYGEVDRVSGNLLYVANGTDRNYVHFVIALAGHRCQAINGSYLGDEQVGDLDADGNCTTGRFAGYVRIRKYLGTTTQVTDPDLAAECPEWGAKARPGKGICYVYLRLKRSRDVFPQGLPTPRFDVLGKADILDVRTGTTGYTNNAALCTLDQVLGAHGFASGLDEVVQTTWQAAANVCDEDVALPAAAGGGTQKRYAINGSFTLDRGRAEILDQMRQAMAGAAFYTMGQWYGHAGAADTSVMDISERDLRGPYRIRPRVPDDKVYNAVKGTYTETAQYTETDFPPITNSVYQAQDGGQRIYKDVKLAFEIDPYRAQRLCKIDLERHRQGIVVDLPLRIKGLRLRPWNIIRLTLTAPGFENKLFRIIDWKFNLFAGPDIVVEEYADAIYTWSSLEATLVDPAPDTNLQSAAEVQAPGAPAIAEVIYETTGSAGVKSRAEVTWVSVDPYARWHVLAYRPVAGDWVTTPDLRDAAMTLPDLAPGNYEFKAATVNSFGSTSPWSGVTTKEILGLTAAPADVSGFSVLKSGGVGQAVMTLHPDRDVRIGGRIVIRHSPLTSGAGWNDGIIVEEFAGDAVHGPLPLMTGTYMAKARDSSDPPNWSVNAVSFVATEGMVTGWTTVASSVQHPTFPGTKTSMEVEAGALKLSATTLIDDIMIPFDEWNTFDILGGIAPSGSYQFDAPIDCGTVATRRIEADIAVLSFDAEDYIDSRTGLIDSWGPIDGGEVNNCDATLYAAITNDDPAGSPTWSGWIPFFVAEFTFRGVKFKLDSISGSSTNNIAVSALAVDIKVPA